MSDATMRVGDSERERAIAQLGEHASAGRLTEDELTERISQSGAARTRGELRAVFADLPEPHPLPPEVPEAPDEPAAAAGPSPWPTRPEPAEQPGRTDAPAWPTLDAPEAPASGAPANFPIYQPNDDQRVASTSSAPEYPDPLRPGQGSAQRSGTDWMSYIWLLVPAAVLLTLVSRGNAWMAVPLAVLAVMFLNRRYRRRN